jgi:hypothetical protein
MKGKVPAAIAVIAAGMLMQAAFAGAEEDPRPLSPAQIALFESDHLKAIEKPERLEYRFTRATAAEGGGWVDRVELDVRPRGDGAKDLWVDFLAGEHHLPFPPVMGFRGTRCSCISSIATSAR